ncbi:MAG: hypothetical protein ACP5UO_03140 [Thermoplasmata archaeon]
MEGNRVVNLLNATFFSTLQELFVTLSLGFAFSVIYLIGDARQLYPLLEGIITGILFFSIVASISGKGRVVSFTAVSAALVVGAFFISQLLHSTLGFIFPDELLFAEGALITSIVLPLQRYTHSVFHLEKTAGRSVVAGVSDILLILGIVIFSLFYEKGGQVMLPRMVEVVALITLAVTLLEFLLPPGRMV